MLGVTMGDACGVGPEIMLKAWRREELPAELFVIGDHAVLEAAGQALGLDVPMRKMGAPDDFKRGALNVFDMGLLRKEDVSVGRVSGEAGRAALRYVEHATRLALARSIDAVVTLPVNKEAVRLSEPHFTGHTEFIAAMCAAPSVAMMLASDRLITTHVSTHVSQREAIEAVQADRVYEVIKLTDAAVRRLRSRSRIAVAGLNAHAGEGGAFGTEEEREIAPAVKRASDEGINVVGPLPPDTVFHQAVNGRYDAVVSMYHDQGHIAVKLLDFEGAVNVTLGLPIVRTSVDHGTAFDIAWKGLASTRSFVHACEMALRLASGPSR